MHHFYTIYAYSKKALQISQPLKFQLMKCSYITEYELLKDKKEEVIFLDSGHYKPVWDMPVSDKKKEGRYSSNYIINRHSVSLNQIKSVNP